MSIDPMAGYTAPYEKLVNVANLISDYYTLEPQTPVAFGTSGHRGKSADGSFNEGHVIAITAAVIEYRKIKGYDGPLYLGYDTHGLSESAFRTALEVLAANQVDTIINENNEYSPTPVISFLIVDHNRQFSHAADGLIITPSHNPPTDGGIKYNPPHGGPAEMESTEWIEKRANELLNKYFNIKRIPYKRALKSEYVKCIDFKKPFINALNELIDMPLIKESGIKLGADPLGGSGVHYWEPIAEKWGLNITVVNKKVDPSFAFMPLDSDGVIRMDCSSPYAMKHLITHSEKFDLAFGNDPDFDRHGIVSGGKLMNPNHYLAVAIHYLLENRKNWPAQAKIGKTLVSSSIIDRVIKAHKREVYETPVGFKWFVSGLSHGELLFGGEESAGASFLKMSGQAFSTDKDGFAMTLLAAEIMAKTNFAPHEIYEKLTSKYGDSYYKRLDSEVNEKDKNKLLAIEPKQFLSQKCAGLKISQAYTKAPGNNESIGGIKIILEDGSWFAIRPSGTEAKMKLYAESFQGEQLWHKITLEGPKLIFNS